MALITIPKLTAKAQKVFNAYIRKRDSDNGYFTCISCGQTKDTTQMDAGHYVPVKGSSALRFDEYNVNGECKSCNGFDQFHLIGYRRNLIDKVGERKVMELEYQHRLIKKWSRTELNEIISKYGEGK
jgi:5-methylcytosine-specific restriction endonuclease McrA